MAKQLTSVSEVIDALGGSREIRKIAKRGNSLSLVPSWRYRERFPPATFFSIQDELKKRGLSAPKELWGM